MERKIINDAEAYPRSLAQLRGRNVEWAVEAVREGASLSAEEALQQNVIDLIAAHVPDLLAQLDGREVQLIHEKHVLHTSGLTVKRIEPDWRNELLSLITNPNVAYVLMLIGIYGLIFEFATPGTLLPGIVGAVSLVLSLYAFQVLPISYAGLALMLFGLALMIAEVFAPWYWRRSGIYNRFYFFDGHGCARLRTLSCFGGSARRGEFGLFCFCAGSRLSSPKTTGGQWSADHGRIQGSCAGSI